MPLAQASLVHRLVVPFPAGGSLDMAARLLATELGQRTGDTFLVENRPGADGLLGARAVLRYAGSGQALLMINPSLISAELQGALDFDPLQAFQPVAHLADTEVLWVARADLPVASLAEFLTSLKQGKRRVSCAGAPGQFNRACEWLSRRLDGAVLVVPYKGEAPALSDVLAGHVDVIFVTRTAAFEWLRSGRIQLLASAGMLVAQPPLDQAPVLHKSMPGLQLTSFMGVMAPVGVDPAWVKEINRHIQQALRTEVFRQFMAQAQLQPAGGPPQALRAAYLANRRQQAQMLKDLLP